MDSETLWKNAATFGIMQVKQEIIDLLHFLKSHPIQNFMEVGICNGSTFYIWSTIAALDGLKVGIDFPNAGQFGHFRPRTYREMAAIKQRLQIYRPNTHIMFSDSQSNHVKEWVKTTIGEQQLDFLFLDGDHNYSGVKSDFETYSPYVRPGGLIVMHDIKDCQYHRENNCFVFELWKELQGEKYEFKHPPPDRDVDYGGIGVLIKDSNES